MMVLVDRKKKIPNGFQLLDGIVPLLVFVIEITLVVFNSLVS